MIRYLYPMFNLLLLFVTVFLTGCQANYKSIINSNPHLTATIISTEFFEHMVVTNRKSQISEVSREPIVIVIEGDGRPWRNRFQVTADPTPLKPMLLDWAANTSHALTYVGRPCYFRARQVTPPEALVRVTGVHLSSGCEAYWYTFGRYSSPVVESLLTVIDELEPKQCKIILGHSGGGTLAMLIGRRLNSVGAVVTLAGNLNVTKWVQNHNYTPLVGSLDPALEPVLEEGVKQIHVGTRNDSEVLVDWIEQEAKRQSAQIVFWSVPNHSEWQSVWPQLDVLIDNLKKVKLCD